MNTRADWLSYALFFLAGLIGLAAFTYPFFLSLPQLTQVQDNGAIAPGLTMLLLALCLLVLLVEVQGQAISAKTVALLGVLVAITSVLRFLEVAIPGPGGFSPIFAPIILAGYVFGSRFGFLLGVMVLLTSALVTGTVGPWLPFQMFAAGWVGLTAGWLPKAFHPRFTLLLLAGFGFLWGLLFGVIMNLYFYPFAVGTTPTVWTPGLGFREGVVRYAAFYAGTSFLWDITRGVGNVLLILLLGMPAIRALSRFRDRFRVEIGD